MTELPQAIVDACDAAIVAAVTANPGVLTYADGIQVILATAFPMRDAQIRAEHAEQIAKLENQIRMWRTAAEGARKDRNDFIREHGRRGAEDRDALKRVAAVATTRRKTVAVADLRIALGWDHTATAEEDGSEEAGERG